MANWAYKGPSQTAVSNSATTVALARTPAATGDLLIVFMWANANTGTPTCSDTAANTWNALPTQLSGLTWETKVWWAVANGNTSTTITVNNGTGGALAMGMGVDEFSGNHASPLDQHTEAAAFSSSSPHVSGSITLGTDDALIWCGFGEDVTAGNFVSNGQIDGSVATGGFKEQSATPTYASEFKALSGKNGSSVTAGYNVSPGGTFTSHIISFKPAATGNGGTAKIGTFDKTLRPLAWFSETAVFEGWVCNENIGTGSTDVTVTLSGVSATGALGVLAPSTAVGVTQVLGTGSVGTILPANSPALTQVAGAGSVGILAPSTDKALTQVLGTGSVGTLIPGASLSLTQVAGVGAPGVLAPATDVPLLQVAGVGSVGSLTPSGGGGDVTVNLTQVSATGSLGTLTAALAVDLTQVSATGAWGTLLPSSAVPLVGVVGPASIGTLTASGGTPTVVSGDNAPAGGGIEIFSNTPGSVLLGGGGGLT